MSKYSFLVYHLEYEVFLENLRQLGVVHILEKQNEISDAVRENYELIKQINQVVKFLQNRESAKKENGNNDIDKGQEAFEEVRKLISDLEQKHQQLLLLNKEISIVEPWGNFSIDTINNLNKDRISVRFYSVLQRKFDPQWEQDYALSIIGSQTGLFYFVIIQREGEEIDIDAEELRIPERAVGDLRFLLQKLEENIKLLHTEFDRHASENLQSILNYRLSVIENTEYTKAIENTEKEAEEKVMLIEGWVPHTKENDLVTYLNDSSALYLKQQISEKDKVPILLKNKKFAEKFEVLGELYSLPSYKELDLTPFFAPFYLLFFGFCLGDVGYGILMAVAAILIRPKVAKEMKQIVGLILYLGLSTILFGLIGGTFFGIPLYETNLPVYRELAIKLSDKGTDINNVLFYLSLVLGGIQILFGMVLKAINESKQFGWHFAVGTIGWILLLTGGIGIYMISYFMNIPMESLKPLTYILLGISLAMILLFNNLKRNILLNFGIGLWNSYNMVTGILGDLLSYIRLFALGISSAILGFVFNSLAISMSGDIPVLSILIMVIILVIGHGINLFMSGLGSFVHPMRLTFVEFYKNAGFSGGGKKYNPFRKLT